MNKKGYVDSFVAFIDILGFKNYIKSSDFKDVDDLFKSINFSLETILKHNNNIFKKEMLDTVTVNVISDSIVISVPKSTRLSLEILLIMVNTVTFNILCRHGLLCRGAIAEGKFYSEKNIAYGPAFVEAYMLESSIAIYPRIIFTRHTFDSYYKICTTHDINGLNDLMELNVDDELFCANYIGYSLLRIDQEVMDSSITYDTANAIFYKIKNVIEDEIACKTDIRIREKYLYFRKYYNNEILNLKKMYMLSFKCDYIFGEGYPGDEELYKQLEYSQNYSNNTITNSSNVALGKSSNVIIENNSHH